MFTRSTKSKVLNYLLIALVFTSLATKETYAYLDPGSSSYLLQILLAGVFSALLMLKTFWENIITIIRRIFNKKDETPTEKSEK